VDLESLFRWKLFVALGTDDAALVDVEVVEVRHEVGDAARRLTAPPTVPVLHLAPS